MAPVQTMGSRSRTHKEIDEAVPYHIEGTSYRSEGDEENKILADTGQEVADELKPYEGQWIVVEGSQLIAHDFDFEKVVNEARAKGVNIPYVVKVEAEKEPPFIG